jgi:hypothetical protein
VFWFWLGFRAYDQNVTGRLDRKRACSVSVLDGFQVVPSTQFNFHRLFIKPPSIGSSNTRLDLFNSSVVSLFTFETTDAKMRVRSLIILSRMILASTSTVAAAFSPPNTLYYLQQHHHSSTLQLNLASRRGKGFGNTSPEKETLRQPTDKVVTPTTSSLQQQSVATQPQKQNDGQRALEQLRRERAEQKDAQLRQVRDVLQADQQLQEQPAVIPEQVSARILKRMLPFVGLPFVVGIGSFVAFWYLATYKNQEFQPAMVATTTVTVLVVGLLVCIYLYI